MLFDAFICHASEDKDRFVRPLAERLSEHHLEIWYDEFSMSVGDSLRRSIDRGLAKSRFGIVVISPSFFKKGWAQRELDGLVARQTVEDRRLILPIWHDVSVADVLEYSPPLADTIAIQSSGGIDTVCASLLKKLRPDESPLISARDELLKRGLAPPVISDEWWLDLVEASNRMNGYGAYVPPETVWGPWTFPLPNSGESGTLRGVRLAWTAMQLEWSEYAEREKICQITPPELVHDFLNSFEGLKEISKKYPDHMACYAPQLTIPDFSGEYSDGFESVLQESIRENAEYALTSPTSGTALTVDGKPPLCKKEWALRHPTFGNYQSRHVANFFVHGEMFSPTSQVYEHFDYFVWLLSDESRWLPTMHREFLTDGLANFAIWSAQSKHAEKSPNAFIERTYSARNAKTFRFTKQVRTGLTELIGDSLIELGIRASANSIADKFIACSTVEKFFENKARSRQR